MPRLKAEGADAIVVVIHEGLDTDGRYNDPACPGVSGDLLAILARLDPAIDVVVSGHTHHSYICDYGRIDPSRPFLVTSAERSGMLLTAIDLAIDPARNRVVARHAEQLIVQGEAYRNERGPVPLTDRFPRFAPDPAGRRFGRPLCRGGRGRSAPASSAGCRGPALKEAAPSGESVLGDLIADAHLAATRAPENGGAQIAFTNQTSVRADIIPAADGSVTFGQLFTAQPFGNNLVVKSFTGRQLRALLEQQFASGSNTVESPIMLLPSRGLTYSYDLTRPEGAAHPRPPAGRRADQRRRALPGGDEQLPRHRRRQFHALPRGRRCRSAVRSMSRRWSATSPPAARSPRRRRTGSPVCRRPDRRPGKEGQSLFFQRGRRGGREKRDSPSFSGGEQRRPSPFRR